MAVLALPLSQEVLNEDSLLHVSLPTKIIFILDDIDPNDCEHGKAIYEHCGRQSDKWSFVPIIESD